MRDQMEPGGVPLAYVAVSDAINYYEFVAQPAFGAFFLGLGFILTGGRNFLYGTGVDNVFYVPADPDPFMVPADPDPDPVYGSAG